MPKEKKNLSFMQKIFIVWGIEAVFIVITILNISDKAAILSSVYLSVAVIITVVLKKNNNKNRINLPSEAKKFERAYKNNEIKEYILGENGYMFYDEFGREPEVGTGNLYYHAIEQAIVPLNDYIGENKVVNSLLDTVREMILSDDAYQVRACAHFLNAVVVMHGIERLSIEYEKLTELLSLIIQEAKENKKAFSLVISITGRGTNLYDESINFVKETKEEMEKQKI